MHKLRFYSVEFVLVFVLGLAVLYFGYLGYGLLIPTDEPFSGERAQFYIAQQLEFGERPTGSAGNERTADWLTEELTKHRGDRMGWDVVRQSFVVSETVMAENIIAMHADGVDEGSPLILATHYDTRISADRDPDETMRTQPSPGANTGGSGTAVLLELSRTLNLAAVGRPVCLVFLDAEDNGGIDGWDYAMGSQEFLARLAVDTPRCSSPEAFVYLDMVGGSEANIAALSPNAPEIAFALREIAADLGIEDAFQGPQLQDPEDAVTYAAGAGIPSVLLADLSYRYRYTTNDTLPRINPDTLQTIGSVLKIWLEDGAPF